MIADNPGLFVKPAGNLSSNRSLQGKSRMMAVRYLKSILLLFLLCAAAHAEDLPENSYVWKTDKVYRFDYSKTTVVSSPGGSGDVRKTTVTGVLIFEITEVTPDGALARMRMDSPRVSLPPIEFYSSQFEEPELQKDKDRVVGKAMEGAIKAAVWQVRLKADGTIMILQRTPADFSEWLKETRNAAGWRGKTVKKIGDMIENEMGFRSPVDDRETLLFLGKPPAAVEPQFKLRAVRSGISVAGKEDDKTRVNFLRTTSTEPPITYSIPNLDAEGDVTVTLNRIVAGECKAVFDTRIGNVDTINEEYTAQTSLHYRKDTIEREIKVQYQLKRLAPPIVK